MGIPRRAIDPLAISPGKLVDALRESSYFHGKWPSIPPTGVSATGGFADPSGATGDNNLYTLYGLNVLSLLSHVKGAGQTLVLPTEDATNGWLLAGLDAAVSEGVEYLVGGKESIHNPFAMTVPAGEGRGPGNKFLRLKFQTDDEANLAECAVGFRADAFEAALDDYTDLAALNIQYDTDAAYIRTETILNDDATVVTETGLTLAADTDVILEVKMFGNSPRFFVNGNEVVRSSMVFDEDDVIYPFIFWLQNATAGSIFAWKELTVGDIGDDTESWLF